MIKKIFLTLFLTVSTLLAPPPPSGTWLLYSFANSAKYIPSAAPGASGDIATFSLPEAKPSSKYPAFLTTAVDTNFLGDLTGKTISATLNLTTTSNPIITFKGQGTWNTCPAPAQTCFFISSSPGPYDALDSSRQNEFWFAFNDRAEVSATMGTVTISQTFDPANWSNSFGQSAANPAFTAAFQAVVQDVKQSGLWFSGGCFYDIGIAVTVNSGTAIIHLLSYDVQ